MFQISEGQPEAGRGGGGDAAGAVAARVPRARAASLPAPPHAGVASQGTGATAGGTAS